MLNTANLNDSSICMTINPKRYNYLCENFKAVGLTPPKLFRGVRWNRGSNTGCVLAHVTILKMALALNIPYLTIFEDDAYPRPDIKNKWLEIQKSIPYDCGILKLGNSSYRGEIVRINNDVARMKSGTAFGSHAYIIRQELYSRLIQKMMDLNVPDVAMNWEFYLSEKYKPYVLTIDSQLFIQKNISIDNIISKQGGQRYWYPNPVDLKGMTSGKPCKNFVDKLIENDEDYLDNMSVVYYHRWKKGRKSAMVTENILYTKEEDAKLEKLTENTWKVMWSMKGMPIETLRFDREVNGIKFYTILKGD